MRKIILYILIVWAASARADVTISPLFSKGAVLQRNQPVAVWGHGLPEENVSVSFRGSSTSTVVDQGGRWLLRIPSGAAGGPFDLKVAATNQITVGDVWVGEVWLASGQSNMERKVGQDNSTDDLKSARDQAANPQIQMFTVARNMQPSGPVDEVCGSWAGAAPDTVESFSSVAYFFARDLHERLGVPVGIIHSSWGGTYAESWLSSEALRPLTVFPESDANYRKRFATYCDQKAAYDSAVRADPVKLKARPEPTAPIAPASLFNGMISPVIPYTLRGVIWYQGEANIGRGYDYRELLTALISDWRARWKSLFPFYLVQIAPYRAVASEPTQSKSADLREAQRLVGLSVPKAGVAITADLGHECDVHPTPKQPVGARLAALALNKTYGLNLVAEGPTMKNLAIEGARARVVFTGVGSGLEAREWDKTKPKVDRLGYTGYAWRVSAPDSWTQDKG